MQGGAGGEEEEEEEVPLGMFWGLSSTAQPEVETFHLWASSLPQRIQAHLLSPAERQV